MNNRRIVCNLSAACLSVVAILGSLSMAGQQVSRAGSRPNILLAIGDNWAYPHAGAYGDATARTPYFDRLAREGLLFTHAFCSVPSCSPARAVLLTGQAAHRLEDAANLHSYMTKNVTVYTELLAEEGYYVGHTGKGWSPGKYHESGWAENPAGKRFESFVEFLETRPEGRPFCFWLGVLQPHRPYAKDVGLEEGFSPDRLVVPACLPDTPEVRNDMLDYYEAVERMDRRVGEAIELLEDEGLLEDTIVLCTSDNGWQMPRGLANVYDTGTRVPLAIRWGQRLGPGSKTDQLVSLVDFAPTLLELAGLKPPARRDGHSFAGLLTGQPVAAADAVFLERERHANVRRGDLSYPVRAIRTHEYLYVRNLRPARWPAGDPAVYVSVGPYGDVDPSPTKEQILSNAGEPEFHKFYDLSFGKRPAEELYDLTQDPDQVVNVANRPKYAKVKRQLAARLERWMHDTGDPRVDPAYDEFDRYPYFGKRYDPDRLPTQPR